MAFHFFLNICENYSIRTFYHKSVVLYWKTFAHIMIVSIMVLITLMWCYERAQSNDDKEWIKPFRIHLLVGSYFPFTGEKTHELKFSVCLRNTTSKMFEHFANSVWIWVCVLIYFRCMIKHRSLCCISHATNATDST